MALTIEQKANLVSAARTAEVGMRRTMIQLFFLIHSGIFSLVLTQFKPGTPYHLCACVFGLLLTRIWYQATRRAEYWIDYWNLKLEELELIEEKDEKVAESPVMVFVRSRQSIPGITTAAIFVRLVLAFMWAWILLLVFSVLQFNQESFIKGVP